MNLNHACLPISPYRQGKNLWGETPLGLSAVHNSSLHFKLLLQFFISPNYSRRRRFLTFVRSALPKSASWILLSLGQAVCFTSLSQTFALTYSSFATALLTLSQNPLSWICSTLGKFRNWTFGSSLLNFLAIRTNFVSSVRKSAELHNRALARPTYNLKAITKIIAFKLSLSYLNRNLTTSRLYHTKLMRARFMVN